MTRSLYSPLDPGWIRVLKINEGCLLDEITCQLIKIPLHGLTYKALSYTWGDLEYSTESPVEEAPHILVDRHELRVTKNLHEALLQIRQLDEKVYLWVDAICIDQGNNKERSHQVKQMGDIYSEAEEVLIWLGAGVTEIFDLFDLFDSVNEIDKTVYNAPVVGSNEGRISLFRQLMAERLESIGEVARVKQTRVLAQLLQRPWFNRVWILQEVAKAKMAIVLCDSCSCQARAFAMMASIMKLEVSQHIQSVLDIMPQARRNTWWSEKRYLHFLLGKFSESQARLPRDQVYALLGISEDAYISERFYPCYNKSDTQVFQDTACFLLFGEILDSTYSFPEFTLPELRVPLIQLAEKTLDWALSQEEESLRKSAQNTAGLLVCRLNEGQFKTPELLLSLAKKHDQFDEVDNLVRHGDVDLIVRFRDNDNVLEMTSKTKAEMQAQLVFQHINRTIERSTSPMPFDENEDMTETISRLLETRASSEEMLRAYVWAGDVDAVRRQLEIGADVNGVDMAGRSALHLAASRGHLDIVELLHSHGADITQ